MKVTGMSRPLDALGRVVIPKELRKTLGLEPGDPIEVFYDEIGQVILRKFHIHCEFCGSDDLLMDLHGKKVCKSCAESIVSQDQ